MKVLIYGAGAMGLYFAATLAQSGHTVYLKTRSRWDEKCIRILRPEQPDEKVNIENIFTELPSQLEVDIVIIATKAWQIAEVVQDLKAHQISSSAIILTVQNGITAPEHAHKVLTDNPVVASTCVVIVERQQPGVVHLLGDQAQLTIGAFTSECTQEQVEKVRELFGGTPVTVNIAEDIHRALWKKLSLIASYGGVGAISQLSVGQTRAHQGTRSLVHHVMTECAHTARAYGINFTDEDIEEMFSIYAKSFEPDTTSSMQRDLAQGKPSELEDQVGEILRKAQEKNIVAPVCDVIYRALSAREQIARSDAE